MKISNNYIQEAAKTYLLISNFPYQKEVDVYIFLPSSRQETISSNNPPINLLLCFQIKQDFGVCFHKKTEIKNKWSGNILKIREYTSVNQIPPFDYHLILITELRDERCANWKTSLSETDTKLGDIYFLFSDKLGIS